MEKQFKIGDKVKIIHSGPTYDTYRIMFRKWNFPNLERNIWEAGEEGYIVGFDKHEATGEDMAIVHSDKADKKVLIGFKGIAKVEPTIGDEQCIVDREFVMEAYNAACSDWKKKLEKKFPFITNYYNIDDILERNNISKLVYDLQYEVNLEIFKTVSDNKVNYIRIPLPITNNEWFAAAYTCAMNIVTKLSKDKNVSSVWITDPSSLEDSLLIPRVTKEFLRGIFIKVTLKA